MEPVLLIDKLASLQSYFESVIAKDGGLAMVDRSDVEALQAAVKVLMIVENDTKIRKMVENKYIE